MPDLTHIALLYTKEGCCLCDRAKEVLHRLQADFDLIVEEVDITGDEGLLGEYRYIIPVVVIDGKHRFESKIAEYYLRRVLTEERAENRGARTDSREGETPAEQQAESLPLPLGEGRGEGHPPPGRGSSEALSPQSSGLSPGTVALGPRTRAAIRAAQRFCFWFARHWLAVANGFNLLVLGLSAAIPAMRVLGLAWLAGPLFDSYRLICHQLPYRSFFLFGEQMAMCQRNVAIYGSMSLAGLAFGLARGRVGPLPWRWYLALSFPMAVDGFTQLFGLRESTWELRVLTGSLFGAATVWLAYPYLERFSREILQKAPGTRHKETTQQDQGPGARHSAPRTQNSTEHSSLITHHSSLDMDEAT